VRAFDLDTARMTVDFVLHDGGVAARWALGATPGDRVHLTRPRSWYRRPADTRWQLLVADLTGLPALARILEGADGSVETLALVEVLDDADLATLPAAIPPGVTVEVLRGGNGAGPSLLADRARAVRPPDAPGYLWFAGEAGQARQIRKHARHVWSWSTDRMDVTGYWRVAAERWNARFAPVSAELLAVYQAVLDNGGSDKEAGEAYDIALEQAGL
jgi:NADPH-dependent ferric siderophore reductase